MYKQIQASFVNFNLSKYQSPI